MTPELPEATVDASERTQLKVLLVHNRYQQPGGEDVAVDADAELLESRGHRVVRFERHNDDLLGLDWVGQARAGVRTIWSGETARELSRVLREARPDVMHAHNTFPLISPSAAWTAARHGVPVVQTIHNYRMTCAAGTCTRDGKSCQLCLETRWPWPAIRYGCYRGSRPQSAVAGALQVSQRLAHRLNDPVRVYLPVSEFVKRFLVDSGKLSEDRVMVRYNFVDPDPGEREARDDDGYILFAGRIAPEKGVDVLVRAAGLAPEVPVLVAGDGPSRSDVEELARELGADNVTFCGRMARKDTFELIRKARCLVFPSIWDEPCPMVLVEACALGVPAIATDAGGIPEVIGASGTLLPAKDPWALSRALVQVCRDVEGSHAKGRAAREHWNGRFTVEHGYRSLMAAYRRAGVSGV